LKSKKKKANPEGIYRNGILYDFKFDRSKRTFKNEESLLRHVRKECEILLMLATDKISVQRTAAIKKNLKNAHRVVDGDGPSRLSVLLIMLLSVRIFRYPFSDAINNYM